MHTPTQSMKRFALTVILIVILFAAQEVSGIGAKVTYDRKESERSLVKQIATSSSGLLTQSSTTSLEVRVHASSSSTTPTSAAAELMSSRPLPPVVHQKTPEVVRAAYMTSCIASGVNLRAPMMKMLDKTSLNALIIDVKDYSGYVSIDLGGNRYPIGGKSCLVKDMHEFLAQLGEKGIYRIARITVMQDPQYADAHPESAVQRKGGKGVWKDKHGLAFVDPGAKDFWKYIRDLAYDSYEAGFDEVNFDYVRFPTDGTLTDMAFTHSGTSTKPAVMKGFYSYLGGAMKEKGIPSSVDLFGMTTTAKDDLGIGQVLENVMPYFDFVAPMVYPSHYPKGFNGWKDPNTVPGPLTEFVMGEAVKRAKLQGYGPEKFRTWIQDFNYGKVYTVTDVKAEINASAKVGVKSYMTWDPNNRYTEAAYMQ